MKLFVWTLTLTSVAFAQKPLTIASQGSFFVGGETKACLPRAAAAFGGGDITINQMYVQYQIPVNSAAARSRGDGARLLLEQQDLGDYSRRPHRLERVLRAQRPPVYLADQSSRARSGFDPSTFTAVKAGTIPPSQLPNVLVASHQTAWTVFRFGPKYGEAFPDGQFPIEAVDELYKQMIPDLNSIAAQSEPNIGRTWRRWR